ncbi:MAG: hypothetical protein AVO35_02540 [Candidatus Aegiribacteria sp. MLS_C]|nr:MAG: hypothetical protein AVO35_02540 [Candidatus Aegiribacteria sp. MLS_C]
MPKEVLIVDDDREFVETTEIVIRNKGYETRTAHDGEEALKKVGEKIPDIILLDVMMKTKGDGIWVSEQLRAKYREEKIPVIMITAVNQDADMIKYHFEKNAGSDLEYLPVDVFMEKPIEIDELLDKVSELIGAP